MTLSFVADRASQVGPRDLQRFSKWPTFLQMSGSILPHMIFPLVLVGGWATCITCVSYFTKTNREFFLRVSR